MSKNGQTLGELLFAAKRLDELVLPPGLLVGMPEKGPAVLTYKYISLITERIVVWVALQYGMCDVDKIFRTTVSLQLEAIYPNLALVNGRTRVWGDVIKNRFLNCRKSQRSVRARTLTDAPSAPALRVAPAHTDFN